MLPALVGFVVKITARDHLYPLETIFNLSLTWQMFQSRLCITVSLHHLHRKKKLMGNILTWHFNLCSHESYLYIIMCIAIYLDIFAQKLVIAEELGESTRAGSCKSGLTLHIFHSKLVRHLLVMGNCAWLSFSLHTTGVSASARRQNICNLTPKLCRKATCRLSQLSATKITKRAVNWERWTSQKCLYHCPDTIFIPILISHRHSRCANQMNCLYDKWK